jgi:hypothetical protein
MSCTSPSLPGRNGAATNLKASRFRVSTYDLTAKCTAARKCCKLFFPLGLQSAIKNTYLLMIVMIRAANVKLRKLRRERRLTALARDVLPVSFYNSA